jgi:outer membrane lipoprotein-sorting protein
MKKTTIVILTLMICLSFSSMKKKDTATLDIILNMVEKIQSYSTFQFHLTKYERIEGEMVKEILDAKINARPLQVYLRQKLPVDGLEMLYNEGRNDGKALINPNAFPWVNLNLDPQGSIVRKGQHHSLYAFDFNYLISFLDHLLKKYSKDAENMVLLKGEVLWDKRKCYHIEMSNPNYARSTYTVKGDENLIAIAKKLNINEYSIVDLNEDIDNYNDVNDGQEINVPNDYAKRMTLYLDKEFLLPVMVKVYDDKGLYETFEYIDLKVNPSFSSEEFTQDYKDYKF